MVPSDTETIYVPLFFNKENVFIYFIFLFLETIDENN